MNLRDLALCAALALAITSPAAAQQTTSSEFVIDLNLPDGAHQRILYAAPAHPQATLVMLPGGAGELGLRRDGICAMTIISSCKHEACGSRKITLY